MKVAVSLLLGVFVSACTSSAPKSESPPPTPARGAYDLRLRGHQGEKAVTVYHSDSAVEDYELNQKVRDHQEILDFVVSTEVLEARDSQLTIRTQTLDKDGAGSLHDYAFPEKDESIDFVYSSGAQVLRADPFPKSSIFYLPPVSLPEHDVKVGDTWTMDHAWISTNDGLPLRLSMVTIFKDVVNCGRFGHCADLEVSGQVDIANESVQKLLKFDSRIWGRMLFSLDRGDVVWSEVRSQDMFKAKENETRVLSCMVSRMQTPDAVTTDKVSCEPTIKMVPAPRMTF
jgi:hypothetical protein